MRTSFNQTLTAAMLIALLGVGLVGCGDDKDNDGGDPQYNANGNANANANTNTNTNGGDNASALPAGLLLDAAPEGAVTVASLKKTAKEGDEVVMRVTVGGRVNPIVGKRAVMTVVDSDLHNQCLSPDDGCETPWDYCCAAQEDLNENLATVQLVDADGRPLEIDLPSVSKVKPLTTLVVKGKVGPRPDENTLIVNADGLFIETTP